MLDDLDIFKTLTEQRTVVEYTTDLRFTNTTDNSELNPHLFAAMYQPLQASMCYWEAESDGRYSYTSNFALEHIPLVVVPFGTLPTTVQDGKGISYNVFHASLPVQSYAITVKSSEKVPARLSDQQKYFKENAVDGWSAGHLIPHEDSPRQIAASKCATLQINENFYAEPYVWNCHQRSHLEKRYRKQNGVCVAYPMFTRSHIHNRVVQKYKDVPARSIADGLFYSCRTTSGYAGVDVFVPFLTDTGIYATAVPNKGTSRTKVDRVVTEHTVSANSHPSALLFDFDKENEGLQTQIADIELQRTSAEQIALHQGELFATPENNALHHAAISKFEKAATLEFLAPTNKMRCALIFGKLADDKRKRLYLTAIKSHVDLLIDECDGENKVKLNNRVYKEFKKTMPEEDATLDSLNRARFKYTE